MSKGPTKTTGSAELERIVGELYFMNYDARKQQREIMARPGSFVHDKLTELNNLIAAHDTHLRDEVLAAIGEDERINNLNEKGQSVGAPYKVQDARRTRNNLRAQLRTAVTAIFSSEEKS